MISPPLQVQHGALVSPRGMDAPACVAATQAARASNGRDALRNPFQDEHQIQRSGVSPHGAKVRVRPSSERLMCQEIVTFGAKRHVPYP